MVNFVREDPVKTSDTDRMPDWTRVSEGYTAVSSSQGKALASAGNTIKEGAVMLDARFSEYVTEVAKDTAAAAEITQLGLDQGRFHPDIVRELRALKERKDATDAGGMSAENFNTYLLAKTKELKHRYPSKQDEVDAGLRAMGYTPAQDVLRDRQRAADRARFAADDVTKRDAAFMDWAIKQDPITYQSWVAGGQKDGMNGLRAKVAANGARVELIKLDSLMIENKIKNGTLLKEDAQASFRAQSNFVYDQSINGVTGEYASIKENITRYNKSLASGEPDKASMDQARVMFEEMKRKTLDNTMLVLRNNGAYDKYPEEANKALEETQKKLENFGSFIFGKDYNSGSLAAALADNAVDAQKFKFANDPNVTSMANVKEKLGETRYKEWAKENPDIVKAGERAIVGDEIARVQWTNAKVGTLKQTYEKMREEGVKDPGAYKTVLDDMTKSFAHPDVPVQTKERIATYLFDPANAGFYDTLSKEAQVQVLNTLHSKEMWNAVKETAQRTGNTGIVTNFKKVLAGAWGDVNRENLATLQEFQTYSKGGTLSINVNEMSVAHRAPLDGKVSLSTSERVALNNLNRSLRPIVALWEDAKVPKMKQAESLVLLLKEEGFDINSSKEPTTLDKFQRWLKETDITGGLVTSSDKAAVAKRKQENPMNSGDRAPGLPRLGTMVEEK